MRFRGFWLHLFGLALLAGCQPAPIPDYSGSEDFGRFEGEIVASWDSDGRNMTLRDDFAYIDSRNRRWVAPRGSVVNGASIPAGFWSFIGGPFEGRYRNASVVHDVGCEEMTASWEDVHRAFYEASRCGGVDETTAKMMYYAVYHFGPRWELETDTQMAIRATSDGRTVEEPVTVRRMVRIDPPPPTLEEIEQVEALVVEENPTRATIERCDRDSLHRRPRRPSSRSRMVTGSDRPSASPSEFDRSNARFSDLTGRRSGNRPWPPPTRSQPFAEAAGRARSPDIVPRTFSESNRRPSDTRPGPGRQLATPEEQAWASELVRKRIERQTGQERPAEYRVERASDGYRVHVDFVQLDDRGQPAAYTGNSSVRLSRDGQVLEVISGNPPQLR